MFPLKMELVFGNKVGGIHSVHLIIEVNKETRFFQSKLCFHFSIIVEFKLRII